MTSDASSVVVFVNSQQYSPRGLRGS